MWKGTIGEKTVFLVIAVIFMGFVLFILFRYFPSLINSILMGLGIVKPNDLESAILCAIHRCVDGCMSMRVQELSWKEDGKTVNCYEKFCAGITSGTLIGRAGGCYCFQPPQGMVLDVYGQTNGENICFPPTICRNKDTSLGKSCNSDSDCVKEIVIDDKLRVCGNDFAVNINLSKPQKVDISHLLITTVSVPDVGGIMVAEEMDPVKQFFFSFSLIALNLNTLRLILAPKINALLVHKDAITAYGDVKAEATIALPTIYKDMQVGIKGKSFTAYIATDNFPFDVTLTHVWAIPSS